MGAKNNLDILEALVMIYDAQHSETFANQGQCMDGFSALANYNGLAKEVKEILNGY